MKTLKEEFQNWMNEKGITEIDENLSLKELGVDSLDYMELIVYLEDVYHIRFAEDLVIKGRYYTEQQFMKLIEKDIIDKN